MVVFLDHPTFIKIPNSPTLANPNLTFPFKAFVAFNLERLDFIVQGESKHPLVQRPLVDLRFLFQRILITISPLDCSKNFFVILVVKKGNTSSHCQHNMKLINLLISSQRLRHIWNQGKRAHTHTHNERCMARSAKLDHHCCIGNGPFSSLYLLPTTGLQIGLHIGLCA